MGKDVYCPNCDADMGIDWRFSCQQCDTDLEIGMKDCPSCGADLKERHCRKCGYLFMGQRGVK